MAASSQARTPASKLRTLILSDGLIGDDVALGAGPEGADGHDGRFECGYLV